MLKLKKSLLVAIFAGASLLGVSSFANAALPGFYVGGQAGWGDTHASSAYSSPSSSKDTGLAGRIFTGYQIDQNWAVELGYTKFSNAKVKYNYGSVDGVNLGSARFTTKEQAVDLVAKGILPLQDGFGLYGKAGAAYLDGKVSGSGNVLGHNLSGSITEHKILPTFGVGVSYDITPNVPVDLSWNRIQKVGNTRFLRSTDLIALGIAYNFG